MGYEVWFAEDIRNALLAANEASAATAAVIAEVGGGLATSVSIPRPLDELGTKQAWDGAGSGEASGHCPSPGQAVTDSTELLAVTLRAYREGYKAALSAVALAFGIAPQAITFGSLDVLGTIRAHDKVTQSLQTLGSGEEP